MSGKRHSAMVPTGLGFRAQRGGAVLVGVALNSREPRVVLSSFLSTAAEGDRLSLEPYHVAAEMKRRQDGGPTMEAVTAVAEGRKRQDALAAKGLEAILGQLRKQECEPVVAGLLVNRAGWVNDLLSYSLAFPDHPPVAEGLAVREALRFACRWADLEVAELDEKSLNEHAWKEFHTSTAGLNARLKALGAGVGPPWRKEQKLACLAAWVALARSNGYIKAGR